MPRGEGGDPGGQRQVDLIMGIQGVERVAGEQEAGVGRAGKEEGIDGGHIVVEEEDQLSSRVIDLGLCTTKRLGWRVVG